MQAGWDTDQFPIGVERERAGDVQSESGRIATGGLFDAKKFVARAPINTICSARVSARWMRWRCR